MKIKWTSYSYSEMEGQLDYVQFTKNLCLPENYVEHKYTGQRYLVQFDQSCKVNKFTSIIFYASWDNNLDPELVTKHLTYKWPVKEASLHCIS